VIIGAPRAALSASASAPQGNPTPQLSSPKFFGKCQVKPVKVVDSYGV
jgi:hypothetical protein